MMYGNWLWGGGGGFFPGIKRVFLQPFHFSGKYLHRTCLIFCTVIRWCPIFHMISHKKFLLVWVNMLCSHSYDNIFIDCKIMTWYPCNFLSTFTKLQKVTVSFIMSVCLHVTTWLPLDGLSWNLIFEYFLKICL